VQWRYEKKNDTIWVGEMPIVSVQYVVHTDGSGHMGIGNRNQSPNGHSLFSPILLEDAFQFFCGSAGEAPTSDQLRLHPAENKPI